MNKLVLKRSHQQKQQSGFTYIDVMIALAIVLVGVMALTAAITGAVIRTTTGEQQVKAKEIASSTLENILAIRDIDAAGKGWAAVGNIGSNPDPGPDGVYGNGDDINTGIFVKGPAPIYLTNGPDKIFGTADDNIGWVQTKYTTLRQLIRPKRSPATINILTLSPASSARSLLMPLLKPMRSPASPQFSEP
ncbi:MAG: hypothetical protein WKF84_29480 [Pyrinomonadaceae bacterium]